MLIIQHIWTQWTKRSRGANSALQRPRLAEAYLLPPLDGPAPVVRHEVRALEGEDFSIVQTLAPTDREDWTRTVPRHENALDWRVRDEVTEIVVVKPSDHRLQTAWPAWLPVPLFTLRQGETARIGWNGRFRTSLFGSNRSSYYEQHTYWLAVVRTPEPRLFLDAQPRKLIDLRRHIY